MNTHSNRHPVGLGDPQFTNDDLFIISIWTKYTNDFASFQAGADALLNSLRIK
jgi:hypothetical protein